MLLVQKYGGTSVGSVERIKAAALRIAASHDGGTNKMVIIVSAMGDETDRLICLANKFNTSPNKREMDFLLVTGERKSCALLTMALQDLGLKAISLTGEKAGIITSREHGNAKILHIDTDYINSLLADDYIVIVAGFQGIASNGETTTLGRGGSDLSAVALAGALNADKCEIYTDVDGVYTTDPRICNEAQKLDKISYEEMLELASMGAKVLLNRSVELAKRLDITIETKSSFSNAKGTLISNASLKEQAIVSGIALDTDQVRVCLSSENKKGDVDTQSHIADILQTLYENQVDVDMIVQNINDSGINIDFTIKHQSIEEAKSILDKFKDNFNYKIHKLPTSKVSIVGVGIRSHAYPASIALATLSKLNIPIFMISSSEIKLSLLINSKDAIKAVNALHLAYGLSK